MCGLELLKRHTLNHHVEIHYICAFLTKCQYIRTFTTATCADGTQLPPNNLDTHAQSSPSRAVFEEIAAW